MTPLGSIKTVLHRFLAESTTPVYLIDAQFTLVYCSPAGAAWLGLSEGDLVGKPCRYHSNPQRGAVAHALAGVCPPSEALVGERVAFLAESPAAEGPPRRRRGECLPLAGSNGRCQGVLVVLENEDLPEPRGGPALFDPLSENLHQQLREFRRRLGRRYELDRLVGESPAMQRVRAQVVAAAKSRANTVIVGPQGCGREHVARAIHYGRRSDPPSPIAPLDCALADAEILQSTIVALIQRGLEKRSAEPGVLLLLDVDRLPADGQTELSGFFELPDFCLTALSTARRPLWEYPEEQFRRDLALQLSTVMIELPPLAERREDVPLLAQLFLEDANAESERQFTGFTEDALDALAGHAWPGNLNELAAAVREARRRAQGPYVAAADLPEIIHLAAQAAVHPPREAERIVLDQFLEEVERELIERALRQAKGNKTQAAELLGVSRARLHRRCEQWGLE
jgi:DNA-binding NtrC family response regulator